jgi:hypothetical protein
MGQRKADYPSERWLALEYVCLPVEPNLRHGGVSIPFNRALATIPARTGLDPASRSSGRITAQSALTLPR